LDSRSGAEVMKLLSDLSSRGHTVIVITHAREVAEHADRLIEIRDGTIVSDTRRAGARAPLPGTEASIDVPGEQTAGTEDALESAPGTTRPKRAAASASRGTQGSQLSEIGESMRTALRAM